MYKHCTTEEGARRQREFEQCLLELMARDSYEQITIGDICQSLGMSRKSFYRYFSSRQGCLYALIDHAILQFMIAYLPDNFHSLNLQQLFETFFTYWKGLCPLLDALVKNDLIPCMLERSLFCMIHEEQFLRRALGADADNDGYEQLIFISSGITGLLIHWHVTGYQKTIPQMASIACRMCSGHLGNSV